MGKKEIIIVLLTLRALCGGAQIVHDPVMIKQDSVWYLFCTGRGISVFTSTDREHWMAGPPVFSQPPAWAVEAVPGFKGHIWAPDISYHDGRYYLYYAVSAFGKNTSCIGLAVNKTLDVGSKDFRWEDVGKVVQSVPGRDNWNAIDPNLAFDEGGRGWLAFGSFWGGIKLVRLSEDMRAVAQPEEWHTIASRQRGAGVVVGGAGVVAGGAGVAGGSGAWDADWFGVGHNAVIHDEAGDWLVFHGYDAHDKGRPKLRIRKLSWADDWPIL